MYEPWHEMHTGLFPLTNRFFSLLFFFKDANIAGACSSALFTAAPLSKDLKSIIVPYLSQRLYYGYERLFSVLYSQRHV